MSPDFLLKTYNILWQIVFLDLVGALLMTGVIWVIQLVHYPSFLYVAEDKFKNFEYFHTKNMSFIVGPLMILEALAAFALLVFSEFQIYAWINVAALVCIWLVTIFISVSCHNMLSAGKCDEVIRKLIWTNWLRTILWTLRSLYLLVLLFTVVPG